MSLWCTNLIEHESILRKPANAQPKPRGSVLARAAWGILRKIVH